MPHPSGSLVQEDLSGHAPTLWADRLNLVFKDNTLKKREVEQYVEESESKHEAERNDLGGKLMY